MGLIARTLLSVRCLMDLTMVELCQLGPGPIVQVGDGFSFTGGDHCQQYGAEYEVQGYLETLKV